MFLKIFTVFLITSILCRCSYAADSVKKDLKTQGFKKATENNDDFNNNAPVISTDDEDSPINVLKRCKPALCPRIYRPICASVNGIPLTSPTMCHYNDKIRCYRETLQPGEKMPDFRVLHQGICNGQEFNILKANKPRGRPGKPRGPRKNQG